VTQRPPHAAEPYLAFASLVCYLVSLALLPAAGWQIVRVPAGTTTASITYPHEQPRDEPRMPERRHPFGD
jgi:hypothetical protein